MRGCLYRWSSGPERGEVPSRDHFAPPSGIGARRGPVCVHNRDVSGWRSKLLTRPRAGVRVVYAAALRRSSSRLPTGRARPAPLVGRGPCRWSSGAERSEVPSRDHTRRPLGPSPLAGRRGHNRWSSGPERSEDPSRDHFAPPSGIGARGGPVCVHNRDVSGG